MTKDKKSLRSVKYIFQNTMSTLSECGQSVARKIKESSSLEGFSSDSAIFPHLRVNYVKNNFKKLSTFKSKTHLATQLL